MMDDAMASLRSSRIEPESTAELEINIMRAWRMEDRPSRAARWLPAIGGAVLAATALLVMIQLLLSAGSGEQMPIHQQDAAQALGTPDLIGMSE
jgi:hypothetical protein